MADSTMTSPSLVRLSDANYDVAPGEPDVRGWNVCVGTEETIGDVTDLIIDPSARKVRYLDVELNREAVGLENNRHVLVPIAGAQLDTKEEQVVLSGMSRAALLTLPEYDGKTYASGYDQTFTSHLTDDLKTKRITRSAEELRIGTRTEQKGAVRVSKHVETEHVKQSVPLRREEVHVERRPVDGAVAPAAEMRNDEIVVPVMEEEAVVEKRPVVKEEVVISKEPKTTSRTVEADVQREEIDIKPSSSNVRVTGDVKGRRGE